MKMKVFALLVLVGVVAAKQNARHHLTVDSMIDAVVDFNRRAIENGATDGSGDGGSGGEGSGEEKGRKGPDFCMPFEHMKGRRYTPLTVDNINSFMAMAKGFTPMVKKNSEDTLKAVKDLQADASIGSSEKFLKTLYTFAAGHSKGTAQFMESMMSTMGHSLYKMVSEGIRGMKDQLKCHTLLVLFYKFIIKAMSENMSQEMQLQYLQSEDTRAEFAQALIGDFECLANDFHAVLADIDSFTNITTDANSRDVAMKAFGYTYDTGHVAFDFFGILCTSQKVGHFLHKIDNMSQQGSGEGSGEDGKDGKDGKGKGGKGKGGKDGKGGKGKDGKNGKAGKAGKTGGAEVEEKQLLKLLLRALEEQ